MAELSQGQRLRAEDSSRVALFQGVRKKGQLARAIAAVTAPGIRGMGYIVIGMVLVPVVYSYLAYRRIEGFAPDPEIEEE